MALHSFNPEIAAITKNLLSAVIYENISFWTDKNMANERHFYEGQYWTYNSTRAFGEMFPYVTPKQIRTAIDKLIEHKLIAKGNFNKTGYDRTLWYCLRSQDHLPSGANGDDLEGEPIPDINSDNKPKPQKVRAHRLPEGWLPPEGLTEFYLERGLTRADVKEIHASFCDYWHAIDGPKARKLDWVATWRNWIRRDHKKIKGGGNAKSNAIGARKKAKGALAENSDRRLDAMRRNAQRNS